MRIAHCTDDLEDPERDLFELTRETGKSIRYIADLGAALSGDLLADKLHTGHTPQIWLLDST